MSDDDSTEVPAHSRHQRLWTPWRMRYVGGDRAEPGCIFCNRLNATDDRASLILHRGQRAFVIMNLFPYNTGHVMIVPNDHLPTPEALDPETIKEMALLAPRMLRALRSALNPAGFNLGTNVGAVAGAGIAAHLHQHLVPRWEGDANFMPILADTTVLPELIPVTYAKIRAELVRDSHTSVTMLALDSERAAILLDKRADRAALPSFALTDGPVWHAADAFLSRIGAPGALAGWPGMAEVTSDGPLALAYEVSPGASVVPPYAWHPLATAAASLIDTEAAVLEAAVR